MNLIVDVGNTNIKLSVFSGENMVCYDIVSRVLVLDMLKDYLSKFEITKSIISNVGEPIEEVEKFLKGIPYHISLNSNTKLPISIDYDTPETLGVDRMALSVASYSASKGTNSLVIDLGTCITYDLVSSKGVYKGGAISPGVNMRFKSMHHFTESLPLVSMKDTNSVVGKNTEMSLVNGVYHGICAEIDYYIDSVSEEFGEVCVFISGGDHPFFVNKLKNSIFADQKILLQGLNEILNYNYNIRNENIVI